MCCLFAIASLIGPRLAIVVWWLFDPGRWDMVFDGAWWWPALGFLFLPWTTLAFVLFAPLGIGPLALIVLVIALLADLGSYGGGYRTRRARVV